MQHSHDIDNGWIFSGGPSYVCNLTNICKMCVCVVYHLWNPKKTRTDPFSCHRIVIVLCLEAMGEVVLLVIFLHQR